MRRVGLILLAAGLAGFLFASAQRASYAASAKDANAPTFEPSRRAYERWETVRWLLMGMAVMGAVFTALPGKES